MLYAFIDESYDKDRYYVAGYVVPEEALREVKAAVIDTVEYAAGFGIVPPAELHGHEIMSGKKAWKPVRGQHRAAGAIYRRALASLASVPGARAWVEGVDVGRLNARYSYPEPPHRVTLRHLLEAIDRSARARRMDVTVIADEVTDQEDHARRMASYRLLTTGGYRPSKLSTIQFPIEFGSSAESPGLQAADLIAYLARRRDSHQTQDPRSAALTETLWSELRPLRPQFRCWKP